jgi:aminoglycoside N3'-acetyltransferase
VLLLGVEHDANTTIHLAELVADVPYRLPKSCVVIRDGQPVRIRYGENDHCCARFRLVGGWLGAEGLESRGPVGHAQARLARSRSVVDVVVPRLVADPLLFLHGPEAACAECDEARRSVGAGPRPPSD